MKSIKTIRHSGRPPEISGKILQTSSVAAHAESLFINQLFKFDHGRKDVAIDIGDDAAVVDVPYGKQLVVSTDTLQQSIHFEQGIAPDALGHKALAVNLSDMAAMAANPAWVTLVLSMPELDKDWVTQFMTGFSALAQQFGVALIGGDLSRGPLSVTVQVMGLVDQDQALQRQGAAVGDIIFLTGSLGDAALALKIQQSDTLSPAIQKSYPGLLKKLHYPQPRVNDVLLLKELMTSAIDISDGLVNDLGHILRASNVGAVLDVENIPVSMDILNNAQHIDEIFYGGVRGAWWNIPLSGGDDYEVCFTVSPQKCVRLLQFAEKHRINIHGIGHIVEGSNIALKFERLEEFKLLSTGYQHL